MEIHLILDNAVIELAMRKAISEAYAARKKGEDPFGAVLINSEGEICCFSHSKCIELNDPTAHAEVLVIRDYCQKNKKIYLNGITIVSSGEPCVMCSGAIKWAKIETIIFGISQKYIQEISGGKAKPTCNEIVNTGNKKIIIIENFLFEEGKHVFDNFTFVPKDKR